MLLLRQRIDWKGRMIMSRNLIGKGIGVHCENCDSYLVVSEDCNGLCSEDCIEPKVTIYDINFYDDGSEYWIESDGWHIVKK